MKKVLERDCYLVDVASNCQEGIKKAKSGFFHLVLCDIRMPELDGLMTLQHSKEFQDKAGVGKSGFWYDNEWGYSNRVVDLAVFIGNKMKDLEKKKVAAKVS